MMYFDEFAVIVLLAVHAVLAVSVVAMLAAPSGLGPLLLIAAIFVNASV